MTDLFTTRLGHQVAFLRGAFVSYAKNLAMKQVIAEMPWLFTMPILGPVASFFVGHVIGKVIGWLASNAELQAFFINTRIRVDKQTSRFEEAVKALQEAQNPEELKRAEDAALSAFNDVVKYSS